MNLALSDRGRALRAWLMAMLLLAAFMEPGASRAADQTAGRGGSATDGLAVARLTDLVLLKEIDLERYYLRYRIAASREPRWRRDRYFVGQQAAAGAFLASNLAAAAELGRHARTPEEVSTPVLKNATVVGLVGTILGGTSSGIELTSNAFLALKNKRRGNNPAAARREVARRLEEIDRLLAERDALMLSLSNSAAFSLWEEEGKVLRSFRDWCVSEFADFYADIKSYQASNSIYYLMDVVANAIYVPSYILGLEGFRHAQDFGPSSFIGIVGDCISIVSAPGSSLAGNLLYKVHRKKLAKALGEQPYDAEAQAKEQMASLKRLIEGADAGALAAVGQVGNRLRVYSLWSERYDQYVDRTQAELRRLDKVALQSNISGPVISGTFLAQDIVNTVASYPLVNRPRAANNLAIAGAIATTAGSAGSLADTTRLYVSDIVHERKLRRRGELPLQLLNKRLETLDELEQLLRP